MAEDRNKAGRQGGEYMIQDRDHMGEVGQMGGNATESRQAEQSQSGSRQQGSDQHSGSDQQGGEQHRKDRRA